MLWQHQGLPGKPESPETPERRGGKMSVRATEAVSLTSGVTLSQSTDLATSP